MKRTRSTHVAVAAIGAAVVGPTLGGPVLNDDFESYPTESALTVMWPPVGSSLILQAVPGGGQFLYEDGAIGRRNYRNLGAEYAATDERPLCFSFWLYESGEQATARNWGEIRAYMGAGYAQGALQQLYAIGRNHSTSAPGEAYDPDRYSGRVAVNSGPMGAGWFSLMNGPPVTIGWHKLTIRIGGSFVQFLVDDVIGRQWERTDTSTFDCVALGSGLTTLHTAGYDAVEAGYDCAAPARPEIATEPAEIVAVAPAGFDAADAVVLVRNTGAGRLAYRAVSTAAWLSVVPSQGSSAGEADVLVVRILSATVPPGRHSASIRVTDTAATNDPVIIPVTLTVGPYSSADFDSDGDVDVQDFGVFQFCFNGPSNPVAPGVCERADLDGDGDADVSDFAVLQACFNGPSRPPACPLPALSDYKSGGCVPDAGGRGPGWCEEDEFTIRPEPGLVRIAHANATYNCCPDELKVTLTEAGPVLRLWEEEIATHPCRCMCCYKIESTITGLAPGTYTVEYGWEDYGTGLRVHREQVTVP